MSGTEKADLLPTLNDPLVTDAAAPRARTVAEAPIAAALYESAEAGEVLPRIFANRFRLIHHIASGAFGKVYFARDVGSGAPLAVKLLQPEEFDPSVLEQVRIRFAMESAVSAIVAHPAVVHVVASGTSTNVRECYIAMEFLEGQRDFDKHVEEALKASPRSTAPVRRELARIGNQLAIVMAAVHAKGIVHRDLKPANVLVVADPFLEDRYRVKVVDFGIAKIPAEELRKLNVPVFPTQDGALLGTSGYMAPEQIGRARDVTDRADVHAFGKMLEDSLRTIGPFAEGCPKERWNALVARMTAANSPERPPMAEVAAELQLILREEDKVDIGRAVYAWLASDRQNFPRNEELLKILKWSEGRSDLTPEEHAFLAAAAQKKISSLRKWSIALGAAFVVVATVGAVAFWGYRNARALADQTTVTEVLEDKVEATAAVAAAHAAKADERARKLGDANERATALQQVVDEKNGVIAKKDEVIVTRDRQLGALNKQVVDLKKKHAEEIAATEERERQAAKDAVAAARREEQGKSARAVADARNEEQAKATAALEVARKDEQAKTAGAVEGARKEEQARTAAAVEVARKEEQAKTAAVVEVARKEEQAKTTAAVEAARKEERAKHALVGDAGAAH
jgi:hypothetical protein